jgi:ankyrin repeat protein
MSGGGIHKKKDAKAEATPLRERKTWKTRKRQPLGHTPESTIKSKLNRDLQDAAKKGDAVKIRELMEESADLEYKSGAGWTPLMYASAGGHTDAVIDLLDNGADVNARNEIGATALMYAAAGGHDDTVEVLMWNGADVNAKNDFGATAETMCRANLGPKAKEIIKILKKK